MSTFAQIHWSVYFQRLPDLFEFLVFEKSWKSITRISFLRITESHEGRCHYRNKPSTTAQYYLLWLIFNVSVCLQIQFFEAHLHASLAWNRLQNKRNTLRVIFSTHATSFWNYNVTPRSCTIERVLDDEFVLNICCALTFMGMHFNSPEI